MVVLLLFIGLAIDFGLAYVTKADLGKALDAASLSGALNLYQGQAQAAAIAKSAFAMNYSSSGRNVSPPVVNITFSTATDGSGDPLVSASGSASVGTYFGGILPAFATLNTAALSQSTRNRVVMTLVLDRSGSMNGNGGAAALPPAVETFLSYFIDSLDQVAMVSFASTATTDVPMSSTFQRSIGGAVSGMPFTGATFSDGGLQQAIVQQSSVSPLSTPKLVYVTVFFTDGHANTIQDTLNCGGAVGNGLVNYGGEDKEYAGETGLGVVFMNPRTGTQLGNQTQQGGACAVQFPDHSDGAKLVPPQPYALEDITWVNVSQGSDTGVPGDAEYRAVQTSNALRATNGTTVYAIGLGNDINKNFLYQVANDPQSSTYNPALPVGEADFAPEASQLNAVFELLARKILLRLTE
jgi:Flp pilus assembly protein TadG